MPRMPKNAIASAAWSRSMRSATLAASTPARLSARAVGRLRDEPAGLVCEQP
ncbi:MULTISPECIES: hypothetical protein [Actinomycetes]|uniref:hypothetical protein n=1 Tax=Actinomycetes TaxID=1760 RepID=UPI001319F16B|nr:MULTISPECIES: hypothetical protein [Actinomycetes]